MKVSDRFDLIDRIARELQSRYKSYELPDYLRAFEIPLPEGMDPFNSKWAYAKAALTPMSLSMLGKVADDLKINAAAFVAGAAEPPRNWKDVTDLRLFISHISADKDKATRLRVCLAPFGIAGFVAHEDIHPTLEWQGEIERALHTMDAFLAIHTAGFSKSIWTQQEIGFAVARSVRIISLKMGEDPTGFISKQQALARRGRTAEQIASEVDAILSADPLTRDKMISAKAAKMSASSLDDDIPF